MRKFIHDSWEGVMNLDKNPLRHIPDLQVRHLTLQILAWMWCITFSLLLGSWTVFGYTAIAHFVFILAIIITVATFKAAEKSKAIGDIELLLKKNAVDNILFRKINIINKGEIDNIPKLVNSQGIEIK